MATFIIIMFLFIIGMTLMDKSDKDKK